MALERGFLQGVREGTKAQPQGPVDRQELHLIPWGFPASRDPSQLSSCPEPDCKPLGCPVDCPRGTQARSLPPLVWELGCWATPCGLRKGRNVTEAGCGWENSASCGFFLGPRETRAEMEAPLPAPDTHTRAFLPCSVEPEAKDTLWKSEFHSLLANIGFLLRKVCVRSGAQCGRGAWWRGCLSRWDDGPTFPGPGWHL